MDKFNIHIDSFAQIILYYFGNLNLITLSIIPHMHSLPLRLPKQVIPQNYLEDEEALRYIDDLCSLISSSEGVDSVYAKFCSFISNSL